MIAAFIFYSCNEERLETSEPTPKASSESYEQVLKDRIAKQVAKNLAVQTKTKGVTAFLKAESLKQFDGDYNFLIANSLDKPVEVNTSSGRTSRSFGEILAGTNSQGRVNTSLLDSISEYYPLLQVALSDTGEGVENWDPENRSTLVAFVPSGEIGKRPSRHMMQRVKHMNYLQKKRPMKL